MASRCWAIEGGRRKPREDTKIYTLYHGIQTGSAGPLALLDLVGAPYRTVSIDINAPDHPTAELLAVNPLGQIPVVAMPGGGIVTESAAMMIAIADDHPESGMAPATDAPERPAFLGWMVYLAANVYPAVRRYFFSGEIAESETARDEVRRMAMKEVQRDWRAMEARLDPAPYLLGESPSALDLYTAMLSRWAIEQDWFREACPKLAAARDRIEAVPKVAAVWRENFRNFTE
ncbi:MAG: glutathione S-transferase family protein [Proteobacteria bacterium]|nr:glutathione S-transferase family protein [Pseudomonadota bacterium]